MPLISLTDPADLGPADGDRDTEADTPASRLMRSLEETLTGERVSVGELIDMLRGRGQGLLLLILALPMCVPNIPGASTLFGVLLIAPAIQLMRGDHNIWAPQRIRAWSFDGRALRKALSTSAAVLVLIESFTCPRLRALTQWPASGLIGLQTLLMALILILPMWGANLIPGIAVALTGIGLLQRDGLAVLLSGPVALGAVAWVYFGAKYILKFIAWFADWSASLFALVT